MPILFGDTPAREWSGLEFESAEAIAAAQDRLLTEHVRYVAERSPYYREAFRRHGVDAADFGGAADLARLPLTTKDDLAERNRDFLAVDADEIVDVCLTSATTREEPTELAQTASDLARLAYNEEMAFGMLDIGPEDTLLVAVALDRCFMAGLAYFLGGVQRGARVVRAGAASAGQVWQLIRSTRPTAIVSVPSFLRRMADHAANIGGDPTDTPVTKIMAIGEATRDRRLKTLPATRQVEGLWKAKTYSTYASTETATAFCECSRRRGGHVRPELVVAEVCDEDGRPLPPGETGEVVVTPLGVRGMPLVRFRTGDVSFLIDEPCECGRKTMRLGPVIGRLNQMLKYRGATLFPGVILAALESDPRVLGGYVEARRGGDGSDRVIVYAATRDPRLTLEELTEQLRSRLRVAPETRLITQNQLEGKVCAPGKRKRVTFFDMREDN